MEQPYFIWSNEHKAWWRAGECGYTVEMEEAGRYSYEHASHICQRANITFRKGENPNEIPVPVTMAFFCMQARD